MPYVEVEMEKSYGYCVDTTPDQNGSTIARLVTGKELADLEKLNDAAVRLHRMLADISRRTPYLWDNTKGKFKPRK